MRSRVMARLRLQLSADRWPRAMQELAFCLMLSAAIGVLTIRSYPPANLTRADLVNLDRQFLQQMQSHLVAKPSAR